MLIDKSNHITIQEAMLIADDAAASAETARRESAARYAKDTATLYDEDELRSALEAMCYQFAYTGDSQDGPTLWTGGLSALEEAFTALDWTDPHPIPESKCQEPGCLKRATCGTPIADGYKHLCGHHFREQEERP